MVEIPTCSVVECGAWSVEAGGASNMQPPFFISHFIFLISHFRSLRVSAFRQTPPSTRLGNRGQSCLSTDRRAPTSRTSSHYTAYTRCRFVKLSDHICPLSFFIFHLSLKALVTPSPAQQGLFPYPPPPRRAIGERRPRSGQRNNCVIDASSSETPS